MLDLNAILLLFGLVAVATGEFEIYVRMEKRNECYW